MTMINQIFSDREKTEIIFLLNREIEEMKDGYQEGGLKQLNILINLKQKIEGVA
jgi:hypothetical protein